MKKYTIVKCNKCGQDIERLHISKEGNSCFECKKKYHKLKAHKHYENNRGTSK